MVQLGRKTEGENPTFKNESVVVHFCSRISYLGGSFIHSTSWVIVLPSGKKRTVCCCDVNCNVLREKNGRNPTSATLPKIGHAKKSVWSKTNFSPGGNIFNQSQLFLTNSLRTLYPFFLRASYGELEICKGNSAYQFCSLMEYPRRIQGVIGFHTFSIIYFTGKLREAILNLGSTYLFYLNFQATLLSGCSLLSRTENGARFPYVRLSCSLRREASSSLATEGRRA